MHRLLEQRPPRPRLRRRVKPVAAALAALTAPAAGAILAGPAAAKTPALVKTAHNKKLHHTILVNRRGHSLYSLSAERHGRFVCTDPTCLSLWKPLVVARGTKPSGVRGLGTIKRPDGRRQVTYRGGPLYTFTGDRRLGDVSGEGFRDVGVWHAVVIRR
jgi:predicted lipoprotein with Yx(FWY)xxD motif